MSGYSWVSAAALTCYVFLLVTFLVARKDKRVYYSFLALLTALILWSSGSVAMRPATVNLRVNASTVLHSSL